MRETVRLQAVSVRCRIDGSNILPCGTRSDPTPASPPPVPPVRIRSRLWKTRHPLTRLFPVSTWPTILGRKPIGSIRRAGTTRCRALTETHTAVSPNWRRASWTPLCICDVRSRAPATDGGLRRPRPRRRRPGQFVLRAYDSVARRARRRGRPARRPVRRHADRSGGRRASGPSVLRGGSAGSIGRISRRHALRFGYGAPPAAGRNEAAAP